MHIVHAFAQCAQCAVKTKTKTFVLQLLWIVLYEQFIMLCKHISLHISCTSLKLLLLRLRCAWYAHNIWYVHNIQCALAAAIMYCADTLEGTGHQWYVLTFLHCMFWNVRLHTEIAVCCYLVLQDARDCTVHTEQRATDMSLPTKPASCLDSQTHHRVGSPANLFALIKHKEFIKRHLSVTKVFQKWN